MPSSPATTIRSTTFGRAASRRRSGWWSHRRPHRRRCRSNLKRLVFVEVAAIFAWMKTLPFTYWQDGDAWLGYLDEFPDYRTQGESLEDLKAHLADLHRDLTS